jgi:hypothetical protein
MVERKMVALSRAVVGALILPALLARPAAAADKALAVEAAAKLPPAAQWIPKDAVLAVELTRPKDLLDLALDAKVVAAVTAAPAYQKATAAPGFQEFRQVVKYLEFTLGTDWRKGLYKLLGGGITWAVTPNGASLLVIDAEDAKMLQQLHEVFLTFAKAEAEKRGKPQRVASAEYRGVTGWTFAPDEAHAILGNRLVMTNKPDALKAVIDLRDNPKAESLASLPAYRAAKKAAGADAAASAYVNLAVVKKAPGVQKGLKDSNNPMGALLLGALADAARASNWLAVRLRVEGETVSVRATMDSKPDMASGQTAFAWPKLPDEGALPHLPIPRQIAALSLYRDLHAFYAAKDQLFPERTSGLIFFENMMGIFFSGRDLTEDILAQPKPEIRVVVAEQKYDPEIGTPKTQIPAFAAVLRLRNPKQYADIVEAAWQKFVGLINVTHGQKAEAGLVIDKLTHNGARYTVAYFTTDPDEKEVGAHLNFRPALVKLGEYLVLSSTEGLAKDLIDALKQESAGPLKPLAGVHSALALDAVQLASILDANRDNLVRQNMVEKGATQEQAETQIGLLLTAVKFLGQATLTFGAVDGRPEARLDVKLNLP